MEPKKTFRDLVNDPDTPVLVDFHAEWCGPCHTLSPVIRDVAGQLKDKLRVIKVDVDRNQKAAMTYGIRGVPTMILFKQGKILWRHSGLMTRNDLTKNLEEYL